MAEAKPWAGGADRLVCRAVSDEAERVKTFRFTSESGAAVQFRPGQFITLGLPLPAGIGWRCFTIASSPLQAEAIDLTIKAQSGPRETSATAWMHAHLTPGMALAAKPPAGPFCLMAPPARPLLLISAGSGATPMAAIARYLRDTGDPTPVHYVHLGRRAEDWLFKPEIAAIAAALGWKQDWLTSRDGRPTAESVVALAPDLATREVFCCGPQGFMAAVEEAHARAGGPAARFRKEAFTATPIPPACEENTVPQTEPGTACHIRFEPSGREAEARPGETVLAVSQRLGLAIPYACADGICGTCRIRCLSGEVEMNHQGGIDEGEIAAGDILACCSIPRSSLLLKV